MMPIRGSALWRRCRWLNSDRRPSTPCRVWKRPPRTTCPGCSAAALAALASIRGSQSTLGPTPVATPASNVESPAQKCRPLRPLVRWNLCPPLRVPMRSRVRSNRQSSTRRPSARRAERTDLEKPATAPFLFPDLGRPTPTDGKFQAVTPTSDSATPAFRPQSGLAAYRFTKEKKSVPTARRPSRNPPLGRAVASARRSREAHRSERRAAAAATGRCRSEAGAPSHPGGQPPSQR